MSPRNKFCLFLLAAALLAPAASAQKPELTKFQSRRYAVYTDLPIEQARPYAEHMDAVFDEYDRRLSKAGFRQRNSTRFPFYLLKDKQSYVAFLASVGIDGKHSGGMFFYSSNANGLATFVGRQSAARVQSVVQHEGFHQFAFARIGRLPVWANEGMAEYFGAGAFIGRRFITGQVPRSRLKSLQRAVQNKTAIPFKDVVLMSSAQWHKNMGTSKGGMQYTQSWSIVHFLVHGERGKYQQAFMNYLTHIHKGQSSAQAFEKAFGPGSYEPFEKKWRQYIMQLESDPLYTAKRRLEFLAEGMQALYAGGQTVTSLDDLKAKLRAIDFKYEPRSHGGKESYLAGDDENFQAPQPTNRRRSSTLAMTPSQDEKLPPGVVVRGLQATVRIDWEFDELGRPQWQVVLE